jgi:hypothetical protein
MRRVLVESQPSQVRWGVSWVVGWGWGVGERPFGSISIVGVNLHSRHAKPACLVSRV